MYRIFIVEDDCGISSALAKKIESFGMECRIASDFSRISAEFAEYMPHLVLLDISLPFANGYYWCAELRRVSKVPIVFISSASDNMNIVMAMNMGGDDFISKPFDADVMIAKIQAILRRTYDFTEASLLIEHKGGWLNLDDSTFTYGNDKISLTKNEFRILQTLMRAKGSVVSREKLMETLWQTDEFVDDNSLTVNVGRLRKKLEALGLTDYIETKFKMGYIIK